MFFRYSGNTVIVLETNEQAADATCQRFSFTKISKGLYLINQEIIKILLSGVARYTLLSEVGS